MSLARVVLVALALAASLLAQQPKRPLPEGVIGEYDVEYGKGGDSKLLLDWYHPKQVEKGKKLPCVIFIHGGGWRNGDKRGTPVIQLVPRGYVGVSINYRLSGEAKFPAAVEDCKCSVRWVRANAEKLGIDPDRIGVWGSSAGGHLVLMVGLAGEKAGLEGKGGNEGVSSKVQAVCSWFGPADFTKGANEFEGGSGRSPIAFLGGTLKDVPDVYKAASPVTYASADAPPVLMIHGDHDSTVPLTQSQWMLEALQKAGAKAELVVVKNGEHGFRPAGGAIDPSRNEINEKTFAFFDEQLKK